MSLSLKEFFIAEIDYKKNKKLTLENFYPELKEQNEDDIILSANDDAILNSQEAGIEDAINKSVSLEENAKITLDEKMSAGGFQYEAKVIKALMAAKAAGNIKHGAGANAAAADADMNIFGNIFDVEIKLNRNAQMGGSSIRYNKNGEIQLVSPLEEDTENLLISAVKTKKKEINDLLNFIVHQEPEAINKRAIKFPLSCTKEAWIKAQEANKLINVRVPLTAEFISKHYAKKGIYYIQIGGSGFFYMAKNPANLPIPKLEGNIVIEIRSARGGSKKLSSGVRVVGAGIRVQGRLKTKNKSPYTIDDPESIQKMLAVTRKFKQAAKTKRAIKKKKVKK